MTDRHQLSHRCAATAKSTHERCRRLVRGGEEYGRPRRGHPPDRKTDRGLTSIDSRPAVALIIRSG
jgi:hypothetical protein